jgi:4-amino-4-deoxy-L-arabinose transferase-like glycosyltransferase
MKKVVLISIILFMLLTSLLIVKAEATNERIDISGKIGYEARPISMIPGETRTILIQIKNTGSSVADFGVQILGEGAYLYFNIEKGTVCNPYYGEAISSEPTTLDPGEIKWIRFSVFARKLCSKSIPITITLYGANPGTDNFLELDKVSSDVHISNSPLQDTLSYEAILSILCIIFVAYILIKTHRGGLDAKDAYLLIILFSISMIFRAFYIENLSLTHGEEGGYFLRSKIALTNNWILPKEFIEGAPPIFTYLVTAIMYFFGDNIEILRTISIISGALTVCLIYTLGKALFDRRVAVLSAFFLCFCNYHILYSRVVMMDALSLFFVFSALFLFWKGYCEDRGNIYFYFAGFMLGFGTLIKFSSYVIIPVVILYVLWTKRCIRALFDRRLIILFTVAFLIILPYLFYLHVNDVNPFYFNLVERFTKYSETSDVMLQGFSVFDFVHKALSSYNILLTNGDYMIPWSAVFKLVSLLLFPITMLYHLYLSFKKHANSSLLVIYFVTMGFLIAFFSAKHRYYLLYLLPSYFLLLSSLILDCIGHIKLRLAGIKSHFAPIAVFILVLAAVFGGSYAFLGPMTPIFEKGEYYPIESSVLKVKDHLASNESEVLVGTIFYHGAGAEGSAHYLTSDLCDLYDVNVKLTSFFIREKKPIGEQGYGVDIERLGRLKPKFIIADKFVVDSWTTTNEKKEIYENYRVLPPSEADIPNPNAFLVVVYERKSP